MDELKEPTYDDAVVGLDLSPRATTFSDLAPSGYQGGINEAVAHQQGDITARQMDTTFWDRAASVAREMPTTAIGGSLYDLYGLSQFQADPNFTEQRFDELLKEAQPIVGEDYLDWFRGASSEEEFKFLLGKAQSLKESRETFQGLSHAWTIPWLASQVLDPVSLFMGTKLVQGGWKVGQAAFAGSWGAKVAINAAAGGLAASAPEVIKRAAGYPIHGEEIAQAAAFGMVLGGLFGPMATNPATAAEAGAMVRIGRDAEKLLLEGPKPDPIIMGEAQRVLLLENERKAARAVPKEAPPANANNPTPPVPAETAMQQIERGIIDVDAETVIQGISRQLDETLSPKAIEAPQTPKALPHEEFPGYAQKAAEDPATPVPTALDEALKDIAPPAPEAPEFGPLPVPPNMASNPNFIGDWKGADGGTYRVMVDQNSGLYRVTKVGQGTIAKEIGDLKEAMALIPQKVEIVMPRVMKPDEVRPLRNGKYGIQIDPEDPLTYRIKGADGEDAGFVSLKEQGRGRYEVDFVEVGPIYRGQGLAQQAYDVIEKDLGVKMHPSGILYDDGYRMWLKRNPELVQYHQQVGDTWYSPKRMLAELQMVRSNLEDMKAALAKAEEAGDVRRVANLKQAIKHQTGQQKEFEKAFKKVPKEGKTAEALDAQFRVDPYFGNVKPSARGEVEEILQRVLPKGVKYSVSDDLFPLNGTDRLAGGLYSHTKRLVQVALASGEPMAVAYHEAFHALFRMGMFKQAEWDKMLSYFRKHQNGGFKETEAYTAYFKAHNLPDDAIKSLLDEEMLAEAIAQYISGVRLKGNTLFIRMMDKVVNVLRNLRDAFGIKGFRTAQDIFDDIESGNIAARSGGTAEKASEFDMPNLGPKTAESQLNDPDWRTVRDSTTPRSAEVKIFGFRLRRFDMEAVTGTSKNPIARLLSGHFFSNQVGLEGHGVNVMSAEARRDQSVRKYMTEFGRTYGPAWKEWAKTNGVKPAEWFTKQKEFREQVGMYVADREGLGGNYHPAVKRMGDKLRALLKDQLKDMQDPGRHVGGGYRPVAGSENIPEDLNYLWRSFDSAKVQNKVNLHGIDTVEKMVAGAILDAQPWIPQQYLGKLAKGYVASIYNQALGMTEDWAEAVSSQNFAKLEGLLKETQRHSGLTDADIEDVIARWRVRPPESGMAHTKHKLFLSEDYVLPNALRKDGTTADLAFRDLLNNDVGELFTRYTQRVQGRVALAKIKVHHPDNPSQILVDGVTSDEEFEALRNIMRQYGTEYLKNRDPNFEKILEKDDEYLQFIYDRIKGVPDKRQHTEYAKWSRRVRTFNITRLLGQVGVAQLGEGGQLVGQLGIRAAFSKVPGLRRIINAAGDSRLRDTLTDEIESIGIGGERLHGMAWNNLRDLGDMPFEVRPEASWERYLDNGLEALQKATFEGSGMAVIQQQQLRAAGIGVANWFANNFVKKGLNGYPAGFTKRIAQLGIDPQMMDRIGAQMQANSAFKQTGPAKKLASLNLQNWTDLEARVAFEEALFRYSTKLIQQQDYGSMAFWMSDPTAKTIFQFRGFPFQAWANQLQYNLHMKDPAALMAFVWGMSWNAAVRGMQITALAAGRSDGEAYKEKYLTPMELAKAGFERGGMSSILPMITDTALAMAGQQPIFNARSSGMSQSIFSNPTFGAMDQAQKGLGGLVDSTLRDRTMSQQEIRSLASLIPLMNQLQFSALLSTMISDRPTKAPKQQPLL